MKPIFIDKTEIVSLFSQELNPSSFGHCQYVRGSCHGKGLDYREFCHLKQFLVVVYHLIK